MKSWEDGSAEGRRDSDDDNITANRSPHPKTRYIVCSTLIAHFAIRPSFTSPAMVLLQSLILSLSHKTSAPARLAA